MTQSSAAAGQAGGASRDVQTAWAQRLLDAFAQAGVRHVVLAPGSRSTPFVLAAHRHPWLECHDIVDERSAGFFALGLARVTEHPFAGVDLLAVASGAPPPEVVFAEGRTAWVPGLHREAAVGHGFKLIRRQGRDWRMFDLERDPEERHDLSRSRQPQVTEARRKLRKALAARRRGAVRLPADAANEKADDALGLLVRDRRSGRVLGKLGLEASERVQGARQPSELELERRVEHEPLRYPLR